jgi:MoaA/NifB/PqqE/SkfB family radical SAM enzyme
MINDKYLNEKSDNDKGGTKCMAATVKSCCFGTMEKGIKAVWEITNKCDQNCSHCCNISRRQGNDISYEQACDIVDNLHQNGIKRIILSGGEPFLYDGVFELSNYIVKKGMEVSFSSNGMLMKKYKKEIIKLNPTKIIVSLDGFSSASYDVFRGVENGFNRVIDSIESIYKDVTIEINTIINKLGINELGKLMNYAKTRNIKVNLSSMIQTQNCNNSDHNFSDSEFADAVIGIEEVNKVRLGHGNLSVCMAGEKIIGITSLGYFTPCLWISNFTSDFNCNNISDIKIIREIQNDVFPICKNCDIVSCGKGCAAVAIGHKSKIDSLCVKYRSC